MKSKFVLALVTASSIILSYAVFQQTQSIPMHLTFSTDNSEVPVHVHQAFAKWQMKEEKSYGNPYERLYRLTIFYQNYLKVKQINSSNRSWKAALNQFSDLTPEEFITKYTSFRIQDEKKKLDSVEQIGANPKRVSWVDEGYVSSVDNQGQCGSSWAFPAVYGIEAVYAQAGNNLKKFSTQQMMDCSTDYETYGCNGGFMDHGLHYVQDNGIELDSDYPYIGAQKKCNYEESKVVTKISGYVMVQANNAQALEDAVAVTVVGTGMDAFGLQTYSEGIYDGSGCSGQPMHGITVVGYDNSDPNQQYWILKNTWGKRWGEDGYFRMIKDGSCVCSICVRPSYPVL